MGWKRQLLALAGPWAVTLAAGAAALPQGTWGGDRLRVAVDAKGAGVESDCASGRIEGPIELAADGSFALQGTYSEHKAGPQAADVTAATRARYSGRVQGDAMQLSILPDGAPGALTFTLRRGATVKLVRCL